MIMWATVDYIIWIHIRSSYLTLSLQILVKCLSACNIHVCFHYIIYNEYPIQLISLREYQWVNIPQWISLNEFPQWISIREYSLDEFNLVVCPEGSMRVLWWGLGKMRVLVKILRFFYLLWYAMVASMIDDIMFCIHVLSKFMAAYL